jgi:hypothetical protein
MNYRLLSCLGTGTSIKSDGVKLVLWKKPICMTIHVLAKIEIKRVNLNCLTFLVSNLNS